MSNPLEITEQSETIEFEFGKDKYKLTILNNSNYIQFQIDDLLSSKKDEYFLQTNLKSLQKKNRFFLLFTNLQEVNQALIKQVKKNNVSISKNSNICLFKIKNPINDEEFEIELEKTQKDFEEGTEEEIKDSSPVVSELMKKIEVLENQNKEFEKRLEALEDQIENVKNIEKTVEKVKTKKIGDEEEDEIDDSVEVFKSNIINRKEERAIKGLIQSKILSTELIFDTAKDGDTLEAFRKKCADVAPTLIIIKTDIGVIFGGFASVGWKNNGPIPDYHSFVFTLNPNKKYKVTMPKFGLYGPNDKENIMFQFGCVCFRVEGNCTKHNNNVVRGSGYEKGIIDFIQGDHKFRVSRLEIFKINF